MSNRIAFTGHRPDKLPGGYNSDHKEIEDRIYNLLLEEDICAVIVGGALGIDQIAMRAAIRADCLITLIEPFPGFWKKWPVSSIEEYMRLKYSSSADIVIFMADNNETYAAWKMQKRNEQMVDLCDELWAYWDGTKGGTGNCVAYAKKQGKPVRNLRNEFMDR